MSKEKQDLWYVVVGYDTNHIYCETRSETLACVAWEPGTVLGKGKEKVDAYDDAGRQIRRWKDVRANKLPIDQYEFSRNGKKS